jgi:hypothetical protein
VSALHTAAAITRDDCVYMLTLFCCSLLATRRASTCLFLAVALQRAEGQLSASGCLHLWQKLRVAHSTGCAIAVADGRCNVTAHLCCTECTCSACACLALQRGRSAIPLPMPAAHHLGSALHCMTTSKSSEAASSVMWSVLEEDVMLGFCIEMSHCCVE